MAKIPSMPATDGALSFTVMTDIDTPLVAPTWDAVGLVTEWAVEPAKEHQLLFYGGNRRLASDKKIGESYSVTFNRDTHNLDFYDRVSKDAAGAGTAEEYLAFAVRVKYDNVDHYFLMLGILINEVSLTIGRDIIKESYSCTCLKSADIFTLPQFKTATGVAPTDPISFNAPPAPDPLTHLSPGPTNAIPCTVNGIPTPIISMTVTHTNAVSPIITTNNLVASGGAIGHQSVALTITVYEDGTDHWYNMKNDTLLNIEYKVTTTKKLVMNGFKINAHPISHPQSSDDLNQVELNLDGPAARVADYP